LWFAAVQDGEIAHPQIGNMAAFDIRNERADLNSVD
jgi:hypothetical protein